MFISTVTQTIITFLVSNERQVLLSQTENTNYAIEVCRIDIQEKLQMVKTNSHNQVNDRGSDKRELHANNSSEQ